MKYQIAILCAAFALSCIAADYTWNGSVSSDWMNELNWTPNGVPGSTVGDKPIFNAMTPNQPFLNTAQPANGRIAQVKFLQPGWVLDGSGELTIDVGAKSSGTGIIVEGGGINQIGVPVLIPQPESSGQNFFVSVKADSTLIITNDIRFAGTTYMRGFQFQDGGVVDYRGTFSGGDFIIAADTTVRLGNPNGKFYTKIGGNKIRINGGSCIWDKDYQIGDGVSTVLRMDGDGLVDLNDHTDVVNRIEFAINSDTCGTVQTGADGCLVLTNGNPVVKIASATKVPKSTAFLRGTFYFANPSSSMYNVETVRGSETDVDLVIDGVITGAVNMTYRTIDNSSTAAGGIVRVNGKVISVSKLTVQTGELIYNALHEGIVGEHIVNAGAKLRGTGTFLHSGTSKGTTVNGTLSPGDPTGMMTFGTVEKPQAVTLKDGAVFEVCVRDQEAGGIVVNGVITNAPTASFALAARSVLPKKATWYKIMEASNGIVGSFALPDELKGKGFRLREANGERELWLGWMPEQTKLMLF